MSPAGARAAASLSAHAYYTTGAASRYTDVQLDRMSDAQVSAEIRAVLLAVKPQLSGSGQGGLNNDTRNESRRAPAVDTAQVLADLAALRRRLARRNPLPPPTLPFASGMASREDRPGIVI